MDLDVAAIHRGSCGSYGRETDSFSGSGNDGDVHALSFGYELAILPTQSYLGMPGPVNVQLGALRRRATWRITPAYTQGTGGIRWPPAGYTPLDPLVPAFCR